MQKVKTIFFSQDFSDIKDFIQRYVNSQMKFNMSFAILNIIYIFESKGFKILYNRHDKMKLIKIVQNEMQLKHEEIPLVIIKFVKKEFFDKLFDNFRLFSTNQIWNVFGKTSIWNWKPGIL